MIDRMTAAATCGLGLAILAAPPGWQAWLAAAVVGLNLGGLVLRPPGYRPQGTGALPPVRVERQPSSVQPPHARGPKCDCD